jgi:geranylgeranyl pyrophosphate synthase
MAAKLAAVLADGSEKVITKLGKFAESIGIAFQMQDDVLDLTNTEFMEKKGGRGSDITEGKRSLIIIHTLRVANIKDRKKLIAILEMHTSKQKLRDEAIKIVQKYGSIEYVRHFADEMVKESWREVERLLPASDAKEKLKAFAEFLIERKI